MTKLKFQVPNPNVQSEFLKGGGCQVTSDELVILIATSAGMVCNSYPEKVSLPHPFASSCWFVHRLGVECAGEKCQQPNASRATLSASAVHGGKRYPASQ